MSTKAKTTNYRVAGMLLGLVIGYPVSYSFQPGIFKLLVSFGDYLVNLPEIISDSSLAPKILLTMLGCALIGAICGQVLNNVAKSAQST